MIVWSACATVSFWLISAVIVIILTLAVVPVLVGTTLIWIYNRCSKKPLPYAVYNLKQGKSVARYETLLTFPDIDRPKSVWTRVAGVGPAKNETWNVHCLFVSCEDRDATDNRPYLLLVHGTASCSLVWVDIFHKLAKNFRVMAIDLPGFGQSPTPDCLLKATAQTSQTLLVDLLKNWHASIGINKKIAVFGHSFGGFICTHFAYTCPDIVESVILADTPGILPTLDSYGAYWAVFFKLSPVQRVLRFLGPLAVWVAYTWFSFGHYDAKKYYRFQNLAEPTAVGDLLVAKNITVEWCTGKAYWHTPAIKELLQIQARVALIYGEADSIAPPHQGRLLAELLGPDIICIELAGTGHSITKGPHDALVQAIELAYNTAATINEAARSWAVRIGNDLFSYTSCWSTADTNRNIKQLYTWLRNTNGRTQSIACEK